MSLPFINSCSSISPKGRRQTDLKQLHVYHLYLSVSKCCRSNLMIYDVPLISCSSCGIFLGQPLISLVWTIPITSFYCLPLPSWATFDKCNPFIYGDELTISIRCIHVGTHPPGQNPKCASWLRISRCCLPAFSHSCPFTNQLLWPCGALRAHSPFTASAQHLSVVTRMLWPTPLCSAPYSSCLLVS